jgi:hypothetical protein
MTVVGWLPSEANDGDESLFHAAHDDGDEEDLDEHGVLEALRQWEERDRRLDETIHAQRSVKGSTANRQWKKCKLIQCDLIT